MNIVVFEDGEYNRFYPLSLMRPVWELRFGCFSVRERIEHSVQVNRAIFKHSDIYYFTRDYLAPYFRTRADTIRINDYSFLDSAKTTLFINARVLPSRRFLDTDRDIVYTYQGIPMLAILKGSSLERFQDMGKGDIAEYLGSGCDFSVEERDDIQRVDYIWDLVNRNGEMIVQDFSFIKQQRSVNRNNAVTIIGEAEQVYIADGVRIDPFVCFDVTEGPVIVEEGTVIKSFSSIEGPCFIGRKCHILGARIRKNCSFGDNCRIGGEVEESIFHGFSNKYHEGFIGHSYIGEWVNLGALTTTSDLKNNYTPVKSYIPDRRINTENLKVGCFIGDFTKTSIGMLINTGSSIGIGCMLVHAGKVTPSHIPSFAWYINDEITDRGGFDLFLKTCERIMSRRGVALEEQFADLLGEVYGMTADNRKQTVERWKEKAQ